MLIVGVTIPKINRPQKEEVSGYRGSEWSAGWNFASYHGNDFDIVMVWMTMASILNNHLTLEIVAREFGHLI